jgi:hypothetical protein
VTWFIVFIVASSPLFHDGLVAALGGCQIELEDIAPDGGQVTTVVAPQESNPDLEEPACASTPIPL